MSKPRIKEEKAWYFSDVRDFCIKHSLYTAGNNAAYSKMLDIVHNSNPTTGNIYRVAADIVMHSDEKYIDRTDDGITNIMFLLAHEVIHHFYTIER